MSITFTIPGKPFAWRRPRSNGKVRFKDAGTEAHEVVLQSIALQHFPEPLRGPVKLTVRAVFSIPKSWPKKKAAELLWRHHTQKPDLSNIIKQIEDALNRVAWVDDGQICAYGDCAKVWGDRDETVVHVEAL